MKFTAVLSEAAESADSALMAADYRAGRGVGVITLGKRFFFFRKFLTVYYIPYERISRYFRRVEAVQAQIGCCGGEIRVENIVLCAADAAGAENGKPETGNGGTESKRAEEREIAQIQLPGEKAARLLMEELRRLAPQAIAGKAKSAAEKKSAVEKPDSAGKGEAV